MNTECRVLFDTGASDSIISESLLRKMNLHDQTEMNHISLKLADSRMINTAQTMKLQCRSATKCFTGKFLVMDNTNVEIIFGIDLLRELQIQIDYRNVTVNCDGITYEPSDVLPITLTMIRDKRLTVESLINDYRSNISPNDSIKCASMRIPLTSAVIPSLKPYAIPSHKLKLFKDELDELKRNNIITRSDSVYAAPCFIKEKSNVKGRILIDYRKLNRISQELQYHFPKISDVLPNLTKMKFFTKIDLEKGFYQIPIAPDDTHKTAFCTPFGKYVFNRISMGLVNAPKYFHSKIAEVLSDVNGASVFVDDILLYTQDYESHLILLKNVLNKFVENNIIINIDKSKFLQKTVVYLGYTISEGFCKPDMSRLEAFSEWKIPKTRLQLQRLLGRIGWYRPFIRNSSHLLASLYDKLKGNNRKVLITESEKKTLKEIYTDLVENAKLYYPDLDSPFSMNTDASDVATGAIL